MLSLSLPFRFCRAVAESRVLESHPESPGLLCPKLPAGDSVCREQRASNLFTGSTVRGTGVSCLYISFPLPLLSIFETVAAHLKWPKELLLNNILSRKMLLCFICVFF